MRKNLSWFAGSLGALALIGMITLNWNSASFRNGHVNTGDGIDLAMLFTIPLAVTLIFATIIGGTLSAENETPEMLRTKPFPRETMAFSYLLTGLGAIVLAFVIALIIVYIVICDFCLVAGLFPPEFRVGPDSFVVLVLGLGVAFMWYALVQAASSGLRGRGGLTIGLSWAYFTIIAGLSHVGFPTAVHDTIMVLNVLNPLAYMNSITSHGSVMSSGAPNTLFDIAPWPRAAIVWTLGAAACAVAAFNWKRLEF
jgi:ABC-type transport system involved in multi-copper enzyme maturation permease subunit